MVAIAAIRIKRKTRRRGAHARPESRFLVRISELYEFYWSHPVTDPTRSFDKTPYRLLSAAVDPAPVDDSWIST